MRTIVFLMMLSLFLIPTELPMVAQDTPFTPLKMLVEPIPFSVDIDRKLYIGYWRENYELIHTQIPNEYVMILPYLCFKYGVPLDIAIRLISHESQWTSNAVSRRNYDGSRDYGLMQLNSNYHGLYGREYYSGREPFDPMNPYHNLEVGIRYLADLYSDTKSWRLAVMAYNTGLGNVRRGLIPVATVAYARKIAAGY